jgi:hypothetical protein
MLIGYIHLLIPRTILRTITLGALQYYQPQQRRTTHSALRGSGNNECKAVAPRVGYIVSEHYKNLEPIEPPRRQDRQEQKETKQQANKESPKNGCTALFLSFSLLFFLGVLRVLAVLFDRASKSGR